MPGGEPTIDLSSDRGAFLWQDCNTQEWFMRFTAGGTFSVYEGSVTSDMPVSTLTPFSIEASDVLNTTATGIYFNLRMGQVYWDGFDFTVPAGSQMCINVDLPGGLNNVEVGAMRTPIAPPFDPDTLGPCP